MNKNDLTDIEIGTDVPPPAPRAKKFAGLTAKLREMEVGQHIDLPREAGPNAYSVASAANLRIRTEVQPSGELRVWRVEGEDEVDR